MRASLPTADKSARKFPKKPNIGTLRDALHKRWRLPQIGKTGQSSVTNVADTQGKEKTSGSPEVFSWIYAHFSCAGFSHSCESLLEAEIKKKLRGTEKIKTQHMKRWPVDRLNLASAISSDLLV